ncbi:extracellular solute-binding protein [Paenibacillus piri]|nr:extracellular solute-binding protein [Paenibacillus piri]
MMRKSWKGMALLTVAFALAVTGCSGGSGGDAAGSGKGEAASGKKDNGPMTMRWWVRGTAGEIPPKNIELLQKKVKDRFNVDLQVEIVDKNVYNDKLNVAWAGGTIPDMIEMSDAKMVYGAVSNDTIIPLDDMVKNDPNFSKLPAEYYASGKFKDKIYAAPTWMPVPDTMYYRVDWAKKLGIKPPTNPDEMYAMLKAFAKNDPDGNGVDDTFGFTMESTLERSGPIWQMFVPTTPVNLALYADDKDKTLKSAWMLTEDMKSALAWLRKAYAEGVLDKEWVLEKTTTAEDKFVTGKVGTMGKGAQWIVPPFGKLKSKFPNAEATTLPVINGKYGANYSTKANYTAAQFLTFACKQPDRCKQVFAYIWGPEGVRDRRLGEEGVTYKIENNKYTWLEPAMEKVYNPGSLMTSVFSLKLPLPEPVLESSLDNAKGFRLLQDLDPFMKQSEKAVAKSADIDKIGKEYIAKIIIGEYGLDKYDELVSKIKSMGLEDVLKEVNDIYKKGL